MGKSVDFGELTQLPLKGWKLHSALDRVQKKTNRLLVVVIVVVVVVVNVGYFILSAKVLLFVTLV